MTAAAKIQAVMKKVGTIKKDGKSGQGYGYLSEEAITANLHNICADEGLVVYPLHMEIISEREDTTKSGSIMHNVRIQATYRFVDPTDGDTIEVFAFGEGADTGDKVMNKAMTGAFKYALRQTFMISTGDDPDKEASAEATKTQQKQTSFTCETDGCGKPIIGFTLSNGTTVTPQKAAEFSRKEFGKVLCVDCRKAAKEANGNGTPEPEKKWKANDAQVKFLEAMKRAGLNSEDARHQFISDNIPGKSSTKELTNSDCAKLTMLANEIAEKTAQGTL